MNSHTRLQEIIREQIERVFGASGLREWTAYADESQIEDYVECVIGYATLEAEHKANKTMAEAVAETTNNWLAAVAEGITPEMQDKAAFALKLRNPA